MKSYIKIHMKVRQKTPTQLIICDENNKVIDKKIPFTTYDLSNLELLYIKTSLCTRRFVIPTHTKIYLENSQIECDFVFGYISKDLFVVIEQVESQTHIYQTPISLYETIEEKNFDTHYIIGKFIERQRDKTHKELIEIMEIPNYLTIGYFKKNKNIGYFKKYENLDTLKEKSPLYIKLSNKEKGQVLSGKQKLQLEHLILSEKGKNLSVSLIQHTLIGNIVKRNVGGIHHIFAVILDFAKVVKVTKYPDKFGVWKGELLFLDKRISKGNNIIKPQKKKYMPSTFFQNHWSLIQLNKECVYAMEKKYNPIEDSNGNKTKWESITKSGVRVEIWTNKDLEATSIYPIYFT
ncbi:EndoU domain-containing protein [Bernardetia sp. MNP-M8]|uniref:EndoU domain-containing protein n=1 Tax=Bernardetia sp. MNP-M8 TaxID=3127470 RepID=UPI0030CF127B